MTEVRKRGGVGRTVAVLVAAQALAVAGYLFVESRRARDEARFPVEALSNGPTLPTLDVERADGSMSSTREYSGRPLLLHFWATWCPPCVEELPELLALAREERLAIVLVSLDDDWGAVSRFFGGRIPREVVRDPGRRLAKHYGVGTLPDGYLVGADGRAGVRLAGARRWSSAAATRALEPYASP